MKRILYYTKIWWMLSIRSFTSTFNAKLALLIFLTGKLLRFAFFVAFLFFLTRSTTGLEGYSTKEVIFFFLTFNVIDVLAQFLFRGVYRFRPLVVSGSFDLVLLRPISALFHALMAGADVIDLITIPPLIAAVVLVGNSLAPTPSEALLYILLVINGLVIATAFHILVLALGILTLAVDHIVWIYRDAVSLGRLPLGVYPRPLQLALTYLIPVGVMVTTPAHALLGMLSPEGAAVAIVVSMSAFVLSLRCWHLALARYTSASS